ncbi:MAG: phosphate acyltransferase, partial [Bacteroidota bacterium]
VGLGLDELSMNAQAIPMIKKIIRLISMEEARADLEDLLQIPMAEEVRKFNIQPRIAMLSFSSFGSTKHPISEKMRLATELVKARAPNLMIDGEMMADIAVVPEILEELFPFSQLKGGANVLICPDLTSANIAYKLLARLGGATAVGPILVGIRKPVYLIIPGNEVTDIVNVTAMAVLDAQEADDRQDIRSVLERFSLETG